jgi:hypothetical protein
MKMVGKGLLYVLLLLLAGFCFSRFRAEYSQPDRRSHRFDDPEITRETPPVVEGTLTNAVTPPADATNAVPAVPAPGSPVPPATSATATATTSPGGSEGGTNATGGLASTPADPGTSAVAPAPTSAGSTAPTPGRGGTAARGNQSITYLSGFVVALLALAGLVGWDVTQWVASRATQGLGVDLVPVEGDPDYDAAEAEWAKGNHLDAINLMRDFLKKRPGALHAAIRIAEIYEKDLNNYLAAALELEDVLSKRLPAEKWGWTAVHLANIYSGRLNQSDKAVATLERLVAEYPETAAAKKARQRLGLPEPVDIPAGEMAATDLPVVAESEEVNLPKGFRKKR